MSRRRTAVQRAFVLHSDRLGARVVSGAGFQFLGIALRTVVTIGSTAVLARLLVPADFGYVAMATVVTEFAALLGSFGFSNILIQRRVITRLQLETVLWAGVLIGLVLAAGVFTVSFFTEDLFGNQEVGALLRVLCLLFVLSGFVSVPYIVLSRQMRFRTQFWIQTGTLVLRVAAAIGLASLGWGVWSLVAAPLVGAVTSLVLSYAAVPFLPRLRFNLQFLRSSWRISASYFGSGALYYLNTNVDLFLIGRGLGATSLGYYQNSRALTDEIRGRIAMPLQQVLFPAFSSLQTHHAGLKYLVLRSARLLAAVVIPVGFGVAAVAPELVAVLYGEQWLPMIPVMTMFGISAAVKAATAVASPLFNACNRVPLALRYNAIGTALMAGGIFLTLDYGIEAVAVSMTVTSMYSLVTFRAGMKLVSIDWREALTVLQAPVFASLVMWACIALARALAPTGGLPLAGVLLAHVVLGVLVYATVLHLSSREYLHEFNGLARRLIGGNGDRL